MKLNRNWINLCLWLMVAVGMVGCTDRLYKLKQTPEEIAINLAKETDWENFIVSEDSMEAIQTISVHRQDLVLVRFRVEYPEGGVEVCEMLYAIQKFPIYKTKSNTSSGLCHETDDYSNPVPIMVVSSWERTSFFQPAYSTIYGYVRNPDVSKIKITWEDGDSQIIEVKESSYMAVRDGQVAPSKIEVFNRANEIIFTNNMGEKK